MLTELTLDGCTSRQMLREMKQLGGDKVRIEPLQSLCISSCNFSPEKLGFPGLLVTATRNVIPRRLRIYDPSSRCNYLLDTGTEGSVLPVFRYHNLTTQPLKVRVANSSSIRMYGCRQVDLSLSHWRAFFDVSFYITGSH